MQFKHGRPGRITCDRHVAYALRRSQKGLRATSTRARLRLVSGDQTVEGTDQSEGAAVTVFDAQIESAVDGEEEFNALHNAQRLIDLARELLSERELRVFLDLHCGERTRGELANELGLTPQRVGQIYADSLEQLETHPKYPYRDDETGGQNGDGS